MEEHVAVLHDHPDEVGVADRECQLDDAIKVREELDVHLERMLTTKHLAENGVGDDLAFGAFVIHGAAF